MGISHKTIYSTSPNGPHNNNHYEMEVTQITRRHRVSLFNTFTKAFGELEAELLKSKSFCVPEFAFPKVSSLNLMYLLYIFSLIDACIGEEAVIEERKKLEATILEYNAKPEDEVRSIPAVSSGL